MSEDKFKIRSIAIYLPQFHPVAENDEWWGKGFTEWTNVAKAKPLFEGHYQPHLPADLGFYDLRLPEVREQQAKLAKDYGIYGFCYYHYWFNGKRILERPFEEIIKSGKPDFPFMLCWANENWTRVWDGGDKDMLLEQKYSLEDDKKHIQSLIPFFKDKRYIRIDNKPVIAIYRSNNFPDIKATLKLWREEAALEGLELYICRFESVKYGKEYMNDGFDAAIEFPPLGETFQEYKDWVLKKKTSSLKYKLKDVVLKNTVKHISPQWYADYTKKIFQDMYWDWVDYKEFSEFSSAKPMPYYKRFPGITPMWDNTSRRKINPVIFYNSTPENYKNWFKAILKKFVPYSKEENLVFINAWNEWAEGNHLEPCQKWGTQYLEATKKALETVNKS